MNAQQFPIADRRSAARVRSWTLLLLLALLAAGSPFSATHAAERVLHKGPSLFSDFLVVSETPDGLRVLRFEMHGARQSVVRPGDPDHLELAYVRAIPAALTWFPEPRRVLVVGLGGGTIPMFLRRNLPDADIDVVEIDPAVVDVARSHFGFRDDQRLKAHVADGRRWIESSGARYDLIVLDAFGTHAAPYALTTREFLGSVFQALAPDGVVVSNMWGRLSNPMYDDMVTTYLSVFPVVSVMDIMGSGNKLVFASRAATVPSPEEAAARAGKLNVRLKLRHDLVPMVAQGLRAPDGHERGGKVLTDAARPTAP
ncbi:MAG: fused MFS/spermidine synthase [Burkholderiales bacterium]|nr:fused MFS/spermidine synthase [Burkholderiales bacterium]